MKSLQLSFTLLVTTVLSLGYSFSLSSYLKKAGRGYLKQSSYDSKIPHLSPLKSSLSDAEKLLAKARALREQAEAEQHKLHSTLIEKKKCQNMETDRVIQNLFTSSSSVNEIAKRIEEQKLSTSCLERVIERLHEREIAARGLEHVEHSKHHDQVQFVRVAKPQEEELKKVQGLIQRLIDAAEIIDEEYLKKDQKRHLVDSSHWSRGNLSKVLKEKAHFLGREHEEEFKKRLEEFYEAARKKKDHENYEMHW